MKSDLSVHCHKLSSLCEWSNLFKGQKLLTFYVSIRSSTITPSLEGQSHKTILESVTLWLRDVVKVTKVIASLCQGLIFQNLLEQSNKTILKMVTSKFVL